MAAGWPVPTVRLDPVPLVKGCPGSLTPFKFGITRLPLVVDEARAVSFAIGSAMDCEAIGVGILPRSVRRLLSV